MIKKLLALLLTMTLLLPTLAACGGDEGEARLLSFSQANSVKEMKELDGERVTIIGYMSTLSPVSGKFMYLMNLPYQSCPFCIPNTTELSNTMAVYAEKGEEFEFTDRAIQVTGVMDFGDFTDEFGYEYSYRIKDATYTVVDTQNMSEDLRLWQQLASTDVITEVYTMFEYINFVCFWPTYTVQFKEGEDYLFPTDALMFIEEEGTQFNYGFKDGYFEGIIATVKEVDDTAFTDLITTIEDAKALAEYAYSELKAENYYITDEYTNTFKDGRTQYKMIKTDEFDAEMQRIYTDFSLWLASWEL